VSVKIYLFINDFGEEESNSFLELIQLLKIAALGISTIPAGFFLRLGGGPGLFDLRWHLLFTD
jgi:hypothetical protein